MHAEPIVLSTLHTAMAPSEHISIEADAEELPATPRHVKRRVLSSYALCCRLHGCDTELAILEDHFLSVRSVRPRAKPLQYEVDLRFANPKPARVRHVSWFWLALSVSLAGLGGAALWSLSSTVPPGWLSPVFATALLTLLAAAGAALLFVRRTTESLEFLSTHGAVTLVSVSGGIGSARDGKAFFVELIKHINAAKLARPQPRQQLLRDEMREHHRLRELGVLTEQQYAAGKARILAAH